MRGYTLPCWLSDHLVLCSVGLGFDCIVNTLHFLVLKADYIIV